MAKKITISPLKTNPEVRRDVVIAEAIIRPTGLLDPQIIVKPVTNQVDDVLEQVRQRVAKGQRVLITTLTKKFAEELDIYFKQIHIKSAYIHSDVETIDRIDILSDLRRGVYDVLIGINLLREGLDLPEVGLVAIFDADKEGFLRSRSSLIQIIGRAARHEEGMVIMYAQKMTGAMKQAIDETNRRREIQTNYNTQHGITPKSTIRSMQSIADDMREEVKEVEEKSSNSNLDDGFELEHRFSRRGKNPNARSAGVNSGSVHGFAASSKNSSKGKQLYDGFESQKQAYMEELRTQHISVTSLQSRLQIAVDAYDFEMAAAIRDLIEEMSG